MCSRFSRHSPLIFPSLKQQPEREARQQPLPHLPGKSRPPRLLLQRNRSPCQSLQSSRKHRPNPWSRKNRNPQEEDTKTGEKSGAHPAIGPDEKPAHKNSAHSPSTRGCPGAGSRAATSGRGASSRGPGLRLPGSGPVGTGPRCRHRHGSWSGQGWCLWRRTA